MTDAEIVAMWGEQGPTLVARSKIIAFGRTIIAASKRKGTDALAQAAIPREPTQAMLEATCERMDLNPAFTSNKRLGYDLWCAMYDAAIAGKVSEEAK